jgi:hypothetical protein
MCEDIDLLLVIHNKVNHPIDARFVSIEQVPNSLALGRKSAPVGMILQSEDFPLKRLEPASCRGRLRGMNTFVNLSQITLARTVRLTA